LEFKYFQVLDFATFVFKYFQGFQAPVQGLLILKLIWGKFWEYQL
jgi:hypothetical protein